MSIADSAAAVLLLILPTAAFYGLNFTGCTPFTSRSGVKKELRYTIPAMAASVVVGAAVWLGSRLF